MCAPAHLFYCWCWFRIAIKLDEVKLGQRTSFAHIFDGMNIFPRCQCVGFVRHNRSTHYVLLVVLRIVYYRLVSMLTLVVLHFALCTHTRTQFAPIEEANERKKKKRKKNKHQPRYLERERASFDVAHVLESLELQFSYVQLFSIE